MGTYLHGLFGSDAYRRALLASFGVEAGAQSYCQTVDQALDQVAEELEAVLDKHWLASLLD